MATRVEVLPTINLLVDARIDLLLLISTTFTGVQYIDFIDLVIWWNLSNMQ